MAVKIPQITMVITLYIPPTEGGFSRFQGARQSAISWGRHIKYPGGMRLHVANDSTQMQDAEIEDIAKFSPWEVEFTHTSGKGLGGALNGGINAASKHTDLILVADDSYSLVEDLDLTPWARVLLEHEDLGAVSLMPPRPGQDGGICLYLYGIETEGVAGVVFERKAFAWNGRPMLYHKRFFEFYGPMKENCSGYEWEDDYSHRYNDNPTGPSVLYPFFDPWQHVWSGVRLGDKPAGYKG